MKRIILHVGLEKTGTTYLQNVFLSNREGLSHAGILYPEVGVEGGHHYWIAKALGFAFQHEDYDRSRLADVKKQFKDEIETTECQEILISSEHFDFNLTLEACEQLKQYFSGFEVSVVIFLRNQIDYAQSLYIEYVKWGGQETFKEFLDTCGKFNFLEKICLWRQAGFPVYVVDYDACRSNILESFFEASGVAMDVSSLEIPPVKKNVSPSIDFIELVRQLNITTDRSTRRARYAALNEKMEKRDSKLSTIFQKREWAFPVSAWSVVERWEQENKELALSLGLEGASFLGGSLIARFNHLKNFSPPNLSAFLLSGFPSKLLKKPKAKRFFGFWGG